MTPNKENSMKSMMIFLALALAGTALARPHLDLEMTSAEYRKILRNYKSAQVDDPAITEALNLGERLSKWIAKVNTGRTASTAIRLTSPTTRRGIPIDKPNKYSPSIIKAETATLMKELPKEIMDVLTSTAELSGAIPMDDETFIIHARRVDRNYQSAARYKSVDQYRSAYVRAAAQDVRGYYYLVSNKITENELRDVALIPAALVAPIKEALATICMNTTGVMSPCKSQVTTAFNKNTVATLYLKYFPRAKANWDEFFKIPSYGVRKDVRWSATTTTVPFNTPTIAKFGPYLKNNIEAEFRWQGWGLKLNFGSYPDGPLLKFEAGVVPHVNALGGNEIVMDSNQPIEEYESQWTIRHEFGHVLGLPDCYHEFYDTTAKAYVNYQLDITDLMCSRAGDMNERIYNELKKAYAH
jgi:hypothetical protein